jgi:hypothetical protein
MDVYHILSGLDGNAEQLNIYIYITFTSTDSIDLLYRKRIFQVPQPISVGQRKASAG